MLKRVHTTPDIYEPFLLSQGIRMGDAAGIDLTPLLLVQVANGDKTVEDAREDLIRLCRVPMGAIGVHSADEPDPVLMAAIANDHNKEVLIFKQSAGTGFDAPRAFVLASTKLVNDADFAMQFIGRVMRVAPQIRDAFPKPIEIPDVLDTSFIYLADGEAQTGFQSAVNTVGAVKSQLEGQTEQMIVKQTKSGYTVITNRTSPQLPAFYDTETVPLVPVDEPDDEDDAWLHSSGTEQPGLFGKERAIDPGTAVMATDWVVDTVPQPSGLPANEQEILERLKAQGLKAYRLNLKLRAAPGALKQETRPAMADMAKVSARVATDLPLNEDKITFAVRAAYNLLRDNEIHTELKKDEDNTRTEEVTVITDRASLAREAAASLRKIPQVEDADVRIIVGTLAARLREDVAVPPSEAGGAEMDKNNWIGWHAMRRAGSCAAKPSGSVKWSRTPLPNSPPLEMQPHCRASCSIPWIRRSRGRKRTCMASFLPWMARSWPTVKAWASKVKRRCSRTPWPTPAAR